MKLVKNIFSVVVAVNVFSAVCFYGAKNIEKMHPELYDTPLGWVIPVSMFVFMATWFLMFFLALMVEESQKIPGIFVVWVVVSGLFLLMQICGGILFSSLNAWPWIRAP